MCYYGNKMSKWLFGISSWLSTTIAELRGRTQARGGHRASFPPPPLSSLCQQQAHRQEAASVRAAGSEIRQGHCVLRPWVWPLVPEVCWAGRPLISPCCHQPPQHTWPWAFANILIWCIINVTVIQGREASGTN